MQIRVSAEISNAPIILNVDCDMYSNNSDAIKEALCFFMDKERGHMISYVQYPQSYDNITNNDIYSNVRSAFNKVGIPISIIQLFCVIVLPIFSCIIANPINLCGVTGVLRSDYFVMSKFQPSFDLQFQGWGLWRNHTCSWTKSHLLNHTFVLVPCI